MATRTWTGNALPVAQVTKWVIDGTWASGDKFTMKINSKSVTVEATSATISTVASEIIDELNLSTINEFASISWSSTSTRKRRHNPRRKPHGRRFQRFTGRHDDHGGDWP